MIRLKPKAEFLKKLGKKKLDAELFGDDEETKEPGKKVELIQDCSFFYYLSNEKGNNKECSEYIYHDSIDDEIFGLRGVSMNERFIFFWNAGKVWKLCLKSKKISQLSLYISEEEKHTFVKKIRTGSNKDIVCIRVEQSQTSDCVIIWDLEKDMEIESFDVDSGALFFQDKNGDPYLAERNYLINCKKNCKLLCYEFKISDFDMENTSFRG